MEGFSGGGGGVGYKQWLGWGSYAWILFASVEGAKRGKTGRHPFLRPRSQRRIQREVRLEAVNDRARLFVKAHMGKSEMFKHFSFHYVGSGDQTQIVRLDSKQKQAGLMTLWAILPVSSHALYHKVKISGSKVWWWRAELSALRRQDQVELGEFKASLGNTANSKLGKGR